MSLIARGIAVACFRRVLRSTLQLPARRIVLDGCKLENMLQAIVQV